MTCNPEKKKANKKGIGPKRNHIHVQLSFRIPLLSFNYP